MSSSASLASTLTKATEKEIEFELNLAPIIDCLTVLITFLLISASFLSVAILDAGISASGPATETPKPPAINVTIDLKQDHRIHLLVSGRETANRVFSPDGQGNWNFTQLAGELTALNGRWQANGAAVTLNADLPVEYRDIVKTLEVTRDIFPAVLLGGF